MAEMCLLRVLDLSIRDLAGRAAVVSALQFITCAASDCKLPLSSIDFSNNRLGDEGTLELARILNENASKLGCLVSVDLFGNGIRDHGAQALMDVIKKHATSTLLLLESVGLHDNDISEEVLTGINDVWATINDARPPDWKREMVSSSAGVKKPFGKLLVDEMRQVQDEIEQAKRREVERKAREEARVKEEWITSTQLKLQPLSAFLQRTLWEFVTKQSQVLVNPMVLRVFRLPTEEEGEGMPLRHGFDVARIPDWQMAWIPPYMLGQCIPELRAYRATFVAQVPRSLLTATDDRGVFFPLRTRETVEESTITILATQIASFHSLLDTTRIEAEPRGYGGMAALGEVLSRDLGMMVTVSTSDVHVYAQGKTAYRTIPMRTTYSEYTQVEYYEGGTPLTKCSTSSSSPYGHSEQNPRRDELWETMRKQLHAKAKPKAKAIAAAELEKTLGIKQVGVSFTSLFINN